MLLSEEGEKFLTGRTGEYTVEKDSTHDACLCVLMRPFTVYKAENVAEGAGVAAQ